jgi:hypothetical protein
MATENDPVSKAIADAVVTIVEAVAGGAAGAAGQVTQGSQASVGGTAAEAGMSTQGASSDVSAKVDVSAPEVIESLNVQGLKDAAIANKMLTDAYGARLATNNKLYDVTATALGLATLGATHHNTLQMQMASDHRDQNHDRQINVNETDAYSVLGLATLVERLRNPTPPEPTA